MIQELFGLQGKRALITGSGQGIGFTLAQGLGRAGASVVLNDRNSKRLEQAVKSLRREEIHTTGVLFDVTDSGQINQQIKKLGRDVGPVDILVNNAGIQIRGPLEEFPEKKWRKILDTNLTGMFLVTKAVIPAMIERKQGKIINICSIQSELARPTIAPYTASKGAVKMLTKAMATDWGKHNIQTNGIAPGYFKTRLTRSLYEDPQFDAWLRSRTPANRWGEPTELIGAAVFLASSASDYVNGHILVVDGGMLACV
jgi:gluconate 5-dehydrogenase